MILEKALPLVAAAAAVAAAVATAVVAAAFALYALVREPLGPAGAAAVVAAAFAAIAALIAAIVVIRAEAKRRNQPPEPTLMERVGQLAREHPVMSAGGAIAAGLMALKNPALAATLVSAFLAKPVSAPRDTRKRR